MTPKQLKKLMTQLDISQADLSRICFDQVTQSDRNIVSTWLSGAKPIPRWVQQMLNYYKVINKDRFKYSCDCVSYCPTHDRHHLKKGQADD